MMALTCWRKSPGERQKRQLAELDAILDHITSEVPPEMPQAVQIGRENGDCLTKVLGAKEGSILQIVGASGDPPYFGSLGDLSATGVFTFYVAEDHHSEAPALHVVTEAEARAAVREFASGKTGLPSNTAWVMV
jgi:hypothetical protein